MRSLLPRRFAALLVALLLVGGFGPAEARAEDDPPAMEEFIAIVRGYDAATVRRTFPAYNDGMFQQVFGGGPTIALATEREHAIFANQFVRTPAGHTLDVGHVVTGLEAAGPLPVTARAVAATTGCSLRAAVTWSGDVGQALVDFLLAAGDDDSAAFFDAGASPEDLIGDIDGYVLGAASLGQSVDTGEVLAAAYLGGDLEATRFRRFVALLGSDPVAAAGREIVCYAYAFSRLAGAQIDPQRIAEAAPHFVERFWTFVQAGLATEPEPAGT